MRVIRGLYNLKSQFIEGCVVTIGNYDGVHLGHQQILNVLKKKSEELKIPAVVIVFEPQPEEFFNRTASFRLTSLREKLQLFTGYNLAAVIILPFNAHLSRISATQFIEQYLLHKLNTRYLIIGDDFSFGYNREGGFALLNQLGLQVEQIPSFKMDGMRVSSSLIRTVLLQGDFIRAAKFLGCIYRVIGRVVHGQHLGGDLGIPTANVYLVRRQLPLSGVYAVKVYGIDATCLYGVANVGFCPTVGKHTQSCEVHILNFNSNLYGKRLTVEFYKKIRDEQKFSSLTELQLQIQQDMLATKKVYCKMPMLCIESKDTQLF